MKIIKFKLSGKTAFFKKPDVNSYLYFTYSQIHKVALLGILGAIQGLSGYNQMNESDDYPEFYKVLKDIEIAIEPLNSEGFIVKKIQQFNNSVGYASKEMGGNLIVKQQWLENPAWNIYININNEITEKIADSLINRKAVFIPYLGSNDHIADISDVKVYDDVATNDSLHKIHSLIPAKNIVFNLDEEEDEDDINCENDFKYEEYLPVALTKETNQYVTEKMVFSNMNIQKIVDINVYSVDGKNIVLI